LVGKDTQSIVFNDFRAIDGTSGTSGEQILMQILLQSIFTRKKRRVTEDKNTYNNSQAVNCNIGL
jgi:hypothetical protein